MRLGAKQELFAVMVANLLVKAHSMGYQVRGGEWWRSAAAAREYARRGIGIVNSNHRKKIAIDLNLFYEGKYLTKTENYRPLGEWWKTQHPLCRWGGDHRKRDGCHFSFIHNGVT